MDSTQESEMESETDKPQLMPPGNPTEIEQGKHFSLIRLLPIFSILVVCIVNLSIVCLICAKKRQNFDRMQGDSPAEGTSVEQFVYRFFNII